MARILDIVPVGFKNPLKGILHPGGGFPAQFSHGVPDGGYAVLHVLIAFTVIGAGCGLHNLHRIGIRCVFGNAAGDLEHLVRQIAHRMVVVGIADVVDFAVGDVVLVGNDVHEGIDAVIDVGEGSLLLAAIDEVDGFSAHNVAKKLRNDPR